MNTQYVVHIKHRSKARLNVMTLADAARAVRRFITERDLGASQCAGADVYRNGALFARVSYNGRVWTPEGTEITEEPA